MTKVQEFKSFIIAVVSVITTVYIAVIFAQPNISLSFNTAQIVLSTSGTGVVTGSTYALPGGAVNALTWQITHNGSAINIALQASLNGTNWYQVDVSTNASGEIRNYGFNAFKFIRIAQTSRTGGTSTVVTVTAARGFTGTSAAIGGTVTHNGNLLFVPDNTYDIGASGANRPRIIYTSSSIIAGGNIASSGFYNFNGGARLNNGSSAGHLLTDSTGAAYGLLQFGGTTSAFPALKRNGTQLDVRVADDSNSSGMAMQYTAYNSIAFASLGADGNGMVRYCSDCTFANPCAGGGTGAIAKRLNGAWRCD